PDYIGDDSFTYQVSNGVLSDPATVTLTIRSDNITWAPCCTGGEAMLTNQFGGSGEGVGYVSTDPNGHQHTLHEGNSLLVTLSQRFTVPDNPRTGNPNVVAFSYSNLSLDRTDQHSIKDAFEVALVDDHNHTVVYPMASNRDAFFNITEGQSPALG